MDLQSKLIITWKPRERDLELCVDIVLERHCDVFGDESADGVEDLCAEDVDDVVDDVVHVTAEEVLNLAVDRLKCSTNGDILQPNLICQQNNHTACSDPKFKIAVVGWNVNVL